MEEFAATRSRNVVIRRMINLGLIADRSEILPTKRKKSKKSMGRNSDEDENSDSDNGTESDSSNSNHQSRPVKITIKKVSSKKGKPTVRAAPVKKIIKSPLNVTEIQRIISEMDENLKETFEWIQESLTDAAEDFEEVSDNLDDGVPLVPFTAYQREAFENDKFKALLIALGFQEPIKEMVRNYLLLPCVKTLLHLAISPNLTNQI